MSRAAQPTLRVLGVRARAAPQTRQEGQTSLDMALEWNQPWPRATAETKATPTATNQGQRYHPQ
eukprot:1323300-Lingulodinium_polyedra.AAC.1